ncbi:MAG: hypothetical protein EA357_03480 [Micavibrio sp.]|nr:MAG: hypothetical protein EA357_03480 [Micavibrio sp.]
MDITDIYRKQSRIMGKLENLQDAEIESLRKTFLRAASPSGTHLDSGDIGYFHARIKSAETAKDIREVFSNYFFRLAGDEIHVQAERNPLLKVLNHTSGDNIEGIHMRRIETGITPSGRVKISNVYQSDIKTDEFEKEEFVRLCQNTALPYIAYYREFIKAAARDPEIARLISKAEKEKQRPARTESQKTKHLALRKHLRGVQRKRG